MTEATKDRQFAGAIPEIYDTYLVPLLFEPYAEDLANRLRSRAISSVLELAAGTGVLTRALARTLPRGARIVATDLNPAMLDKARSVGVPRDVEWRPADAMKLPFADGEFDAVVCQFGAMFFPDKRTAFAQARHVLRTGGVFAFSVWDRIEDNELADAVTNALESVFPNDPPRFLARTPHGHADESVIVGALAAAGFDGAPRSEVVNGRSRAASATIAAMALCQGTPLRNEIEARDASRLDEATRAAAEAIAKRFGEGPIDAKMQALLFEVDR